MGGLLLSAVIWPLLQRSQVLILLATLGLSLIIEQSRPTSWAATPNSCRRRCCPIPIGPIRTRPTTWWSSRSGMGILLLGYFALQYTHYGIWLRAVAQNRPMAAALGVPVPRVYVLAFMVSSGLAAMAGGLLLPLHSVYPTVGGDVIQNAFIIVVAGGLGISVAPRSSPCWSASSIRSASCSESSRRCCT